MGAGLVQPTAIREGNQTMVNQTLPCEAVWKEISNYVDGDMDEGLRQKMEEHFRTCAPCISVLAGTRNVMSLYGDERMLEEVPAGFGQRLAARIEQKLEEKPVRSVGKREPRWSTWAAWLVPVGAVALFLCTVMVVDQMTFKTPAKSPMAELGHDIPPEMVVVVSDGSKLFHVPGCEFIHDKASERKITAKQAMRDGYVPCPRCMREYLTMASLTEHSVVEEDRAEAEEGEGEVVGSAGR